MSDSSLVEGLSFRVHHTMLPVADLDRSIAFYTRLLGMTVGDRHKNEARGTDVGLLGYGEKGSTPFLELTQNLGADAPAQVPATNSHVGIDCSDLAGLCSILEREGVAFMRPLRQTPDGKSLRAWIRDPDGHELELAERH